MRNPRNCIVFLPDKRRQCRSTKASKAKGKEDTVFEPAFLGELCAGHGRNYLEEKPLRYIGDEEGHTATESLLAGEGVGEDSMTEGGTESVGGYSLDGRPATAHSTTIDPYYLERRDSIDILVPPPATRAGSTAEHTSSAYPAGRHDHSRQDFESPHMASRHPYSGQNLESASSGQNVESAHPPGRHHYSRQNSEASSDEVASKILAALGSIEQGQKATHLRLAVVEQYLKSDLIEHQQRTIDSVGQIAIGIEEMVSKATEQAPGNIGRDQKLDKHVASKLEELAKLHHDLQERQLDGFATVTGHVANLQRQRQCDTRVYREAVTDLTTRLEGLKITVQQKSAEEAKANKEYRDTLLQRIDNQKKLIDSANSSFVEKFGGDLDEV
ncbi:hypothetical protein XANCAGTX0491_004934 [Xanthoria calcicola]